MRGFRKSFGTTLMIVGGIYIVFSVGGLILGGIVESVSFVDSIAEMHAIAAMLALLIGGIFYVMNHLTFRAFVSHLAVSHEISDRLAGSNRIHVFVNVLLENTSRVDVNVRSGNYRTQKMVPLTRSRAGLLCALLCGCKDHDEFKWGRPEDYPQTWQRGELIIEPGQIASVIYEFEIEKSVKAVKITTSFNTPNTSGNSKYAERWGRTSVYDIVSTPRGLWTRFR